MDPVSAVGFAASLLQLSVVLVNSAETLYNLRARLRNAPKNVKRLLDSFEFFKNLASDLQRQTQGGHGSVLPILEKHWKDSITRMQQDMDSFQSTVSKLQTDLDNPASSSASMKLRIRSYLSDSMIVEYQQQIQAHIQVLAFIQLLLNNQKLDEMAFQAGTLTKLSFEGFQSIGQQLTNFESLRQQQHDQVRTAIVQVEKLLRPGVQLNETFSHVRMYSRHKWRIRPSSGPNKVILHNLSSGYYIKEIQVMVYSTDNGADANQLSSIQVKWCFTPPRWLSGRMFQFAFVFRRAIAHSHLPGLTWSLKPFSVNSNPKLLEALSNADKNGLEHLFVTGQARVTDYVMIGNDREHFGPMSLIEALGLMVAGRTEHLSGLHESYRFLLDMGASDNYIENFRFFFIYMIPRRSTKDSPVAYLEDFISRGGNLVSSLENSSGLSILRPFLLKGYSFDILREHLFRQEEPWILGDMSPLDTWFIGIFAQTDSRFRKQLESYLDSFVSAYSNKEKPSQIFLNSQLSLSAITTQVFQAPSFLRLAFLGAISASGSRTMLQIFPDAEIDVDEEQVGRSFLRAAAARMNADIATILVNAGANPVLALNSLLRVWARVKMEDYAQLGGILAKIFKHVTPDSLSELSPDPMLYLHRFLDEPCDLANALKLMVPKILVRDEDLFTEKSTLIEESYLYNATLYGLGNILQRVIDCGVPTLNVRIGELYTTKVERGQNLLQFTWLTLAVKCGMISSVKVLVKNGASLSFEDGYGNNAYQLACENVQSYHPRYIYSCYKPTRLVIDREEDEAIFSFLERYTHSTQEELRSSDVGFRSRHAANSPHVPQPYSWFYQPIFVTVRKCITALSQLHNAPRIHRFINPWRNKIRYNFRLLPGYHYPDSKIDDRFTFQEALVLPVLYVVSFLAILCFELFTIAFWLYQLPRPPRAVATCGVVVSVALMWTLAPSNA